MRSSEMELSFGILVRLTAGQKLRYLRDARMVVQEGLGIGLFNGVALRAPDSQAWRIE